LILGSGLVSKPGVVYLSEHGFNVILGSRTLEKAEAVVKGLKNTSAKQIDVETEEGMAEVEKIVPTVDAVLSLLPYIFHVKVAKVALKHKVHFFTTSYVSDAMAELESEAKEAGIILLNECGVDPGTDHMSAMRTMHEAQAKGGKIISFTSFCGGLPRPSDNDNPFGYKFSWAPRGVLLASMNPAKYLDDGEVKSIGAGKLFENYSIVKVDGVDGCDEFECYPNRDSTAYKAIYKLENIQKLQRGTFRYKGWCDKVKALSDLGYLSLDEHNDLVGKKVLSITAKLVGLDENASAADVRAKVAEKLSLPADGDIIESFAWVGLFSDDVVGAKINTYADVLCGQMLPRMQYKEGQLDMLLMKHQYTIEYDDRFEYMSTTMVDYGLTTELSSMSRTVSLPVGICIRLVLQGEVKLAPGLYRPIIPELYTPILNELSKNNINYVDKLEKTEKK